MDKSEILDDPPSPDNSINEMQMSPEEIDEFIEETESNTESERTVIPLDEQECTDEQMLNKIAKFRDEDMVLGMELRCKTGKIKNWYRMNKLIGIANRVLPRIVPLECDITELNRLYYATGRAIGELMNVKVERTKKERKKKKRKSPLWKYRLESEIQKLQQEISLMIAYQQGVIRTEQKIRRVQNLIHRGRPAEGNHIIHAIASRKLLLAAKAKRLKRYLRNEKEKVQNRFFNDDQGKFYRELGNDGIKVVVPPNKYDLDRFWKGIYEHERNHNIQAEWKDRIINQEGNRIRAMEYTVIN